MNERIERISLCMVNEKDNAGNRILIRLADINESTQKVERFMARDYEPPYFDNRSYIYHQGGPSEEGFVGLWRWEAIPRDSDYEKDYLQTEFLSDNRVVEVIHLDDVHSLEELKERVIKEIEVPLSDGCKFVCYESRPFMRTGFLCYPFELSNDYKVLKLRDDVFSLKKITVEQTEIIKIRGRFFLPYTADHYAGAREQLATSFEIIKTCFLERVTWSAMKQKGMTKNMFQQFKESINSLIENSLYEDIAQRCNCTVGEAQTMVYSFVETYSDQFDEMEINADLLMMLCESPKFKPSLDAAASEQWEKTHTEQIQAAQKELSDIKNAINQESNREDEIRKKIQSQKDELQSINNSVEEKQDLIKKIDEAIQQKMAEARSDVARFVADMMFADAQTNSEKSQENDRIAIDPVNYKESTEVAEEYLEDVSNWKDAVSLLSEELYEIGISSDNKKMLSAFLYACNLQVVPVLLEGPRGLEIADAFSRVIYGKTAGVFYCNNSFSKRELEMAMSNDDEVIVFVNPFQNQWMNYLPQLLSNLRKQVFICAPFAEDMIIEPNSLYNYFVPVITDLFIDHECKESKFGGRIGSQYEEIDEEKEPLRTQEMVNLHMSQMHIERLKSLLGVAKKLSGNNGATRLQYYLGLVPYAYNTQQAERLVKIMESSDLTPVDIEIIKKFYGVD